jgi:hypothetical protein
MISGVLHAGRLVEGLQRSVGVLADLGRAERRTGGVLAQLGNYRGCERSSVGYSRLSVPAGPDYAYE